MDIRRRDEIYKVIAEAREKIKLLRMEDEKLDEQISRLINQYAVPPDFGFSNITYQKELSELKGKQSDNFDEYVKIIDIYDKAVDEFRGLS